MRSISQLGARSLKAAAAGGGRSRWRYEFTVYDPGRFPITDVTMQIYFPTPATREHFDGRHDEASHSLDMYAPVVPAQHTKGWHRTILIPHDDHRMLRQTRATVEFTTPDAGRWLNTWPPRNQPTPSDKRLRQRSSHIDKAAENGPTPRCDAAKLWMFVPIGS